jgi:hypothetical protein
MIQFRVLSLCVAIGHHAKAPGKQNPIVMIEELEKG